MSAVNSTKHLSGAVDVYADWVDAADEVKKEQRRLAKRHGGLSGSAIGGDPGAARDMMERRREDNFIENDEEDIEEDDLDD
ncbi:hypothetical protein DRE_02371 [Drechslerella stenobrocha 248]|uniref:Transcription elongation factor 1 homolog n=1 Tax=Drechslerella stenobrocha 248 TaxID=1043628 RepID=W7I839_9PEZI|nr:hypothetical protein DRE_02371 [Drechslerella stenobrocha 248]